MFRAILSRFRSRKFAPPRLACDAEVSDDSTAPSPFALASVPQLTGICDAYWTSLTQPCESAAVRTEYAQYVHAVNELSKRGREISPWVFSRLEHPEYDAREQAAFLLGELARRGELDANQLSSAIEKLSRMATRRWREDTKEVQANTAAIIALGKTADQRAVPVLESIVMSPDWAEDDLSWNAACILGRLVGEAFQGTVDPREAARTWIRSRSTETG